MTHGAARLQGMPEGFSVVDPVTVTTTVLTDLEVACVIKIPNDFLHRTLRNTHLDRDVPQACVTVTRKTHQHVAMVAEKGPIAHHLIPELHAPVDPCH